MLLYRTPFFNKQLKALGKSDKKGTLAAERAEDIIRQLAVDGWRSDVMMHKRTKRGEMRVRKCLKYDLGSGYRLISLMRENELFMLYVGTHDECDRWLNNKRGSKLQVDSDTFIFVAEHDEVQSDSDSEPLCEEPADEYEERLATRLNDSVLRQIFRGICEE